MASGKEDIEVALGQLGMLPTLVSGSLSVITLVDNNDVTWRAAYARWSASTSGIRRRSRAKEGRSAFKETPTFLCVRAHL
jgi:hypothetical protein